MEDAKVPRSSRSRFFCGTDYRPHEEFHAILVANLENGKFSYAITGQETCPDTGRAHNQFYVETPRSTQFRSILAILAPAHVEIRRGTQQQAIDYCKKEGQWVEGGVPAVGQGRRNDLNDVKVAIDAGVDEKGIADAHFTTWVRSYKALERYRQLSQSHHRGPRTVRVYVGEPGSGKSSAAFADEDRVPITYTPGGFFIGYGGQRRVVIDDFDPSVLPRTLFLQLTHEHPSVINIKGGEIKWLANDIVFTSNIHPTQWYSDGFTPDPAVMRRITEIRLFPEARADVIVIDHEE
nr:MAG: hypothetical protein [Chemarfal virus 83]